VAQTKELHLSSESGAVLNDIADFILDEFPELPERVQLFELIPSPVSSPMLAAGEDAVVEIVIRYDDIDEQIAEDIKKIVARAKRANVQVKFKTDERAT